MLTLVVHAEAQQPAKKHGHVEGLETVWFVAELRHGITQKVVQAQLRRCHPVTQAHYSTSKFGVWRHAHWADLQCPAAAVLPVKRVLPAACRSLLQSNTI